MKSLKKSGLLIVLFAMMGLSLIPVSSCKKDDPNAGRLPVVTTTCIAEIYETYISCFADLESEGSSTVSAIGMCWSTGETPTISDCKKNFETGTGCYGMTIFGLEPNTTYYVRAYATNNSGTAYGNILKVTTLQSNGAMVSDIDGNFYHTITICGRVWMAENLKTTKYRNGDFIATTDPCTMEISGPSPKYQWAYGGNEANAAIYGRLYTWDAVNDSRNIAPSGWHVATDAEWTSLTTCLGGDTLAGGMLKEGEFKALMGGYRNSCGPFYNIILFGNWWSSDAHDAESAWSWCIANCGSNIHRGFCYKNDGYSVRCVKNQGYK